MPTDDSMDRLCELVGEDKIRELFANIFVPESGPPEVRIEDLYSAPPIRVRRHSPRPGDRPVISSLRRKRPWRWTCLIPGCDDREPWHVPFGSEPTHPAALAAGLAHLDTHTETR